MTLPILYSLRNCPFAMRARLAIYKAQLPVELRDVNLKDKPAEMITASSKATVPIIVLPSSHVIDESLDVMLWALTENDPDDLLCHREHQKSLNEESEVNDNTRLSEILSLIQWFDNEFKSSLEQYKCAKRYHETNLTECREACEVFIQNLELRLTEHKYLMGSKETLADIALLPFIRQFARVERPWYLQSSYNNVKNWLNSYLQSPLFTKVMAKYPVWSVGNDVTVFTGKRVK